MVSACVLYVDDVELTEQKRFVPDTLSSLFQESDRVESIDTQGEPAVDYRAKRRSVLKRLDMMGCTTALAESRFREWREEEIRWREEDLEPPGLGSGREEDVELRALRALSWDKWRRRVPGVLQTLYDHERYTDETDLRMKDDDPPWLWFDGLDSLISLRAIIDAADNVQTVALDVGPLITGGWIDRTTPVCARKTRILPASGQPSGATIVLAEGGSDIDVLKASLPVFHPDLAEFFTFLDHSEFKVDGGADYVVKFLKAFAAAQVPANIVAAFDNDAAGLAAYKRALALDLPCNIACIHLPDIDLGRSYPTIGPQGCHRVDINGRACGIELYLGRAALSANGDLRPVRWGGSVSDVYQGAVDDKRAVRDTFLAAMCSQPVDLDCDYPEMVLLWQSILEAAARTAEAAQRRASRPPKW